MYVESDRSTVGGVRETADADLLDAVLCEWPLSTLWQENKLRAPSFQPAGLSLLLLAPDAERLADFSDP